LFLFEPLFAHNADAEMIIHAPSMFWGKLASIFWRWINFTAYNKPSDKETVAFINLDESPCALEVKHGKGNLATYSSHGFRPKRFYAKSKRGLTRAFFTYVGITSNIDAVQRALPQLLLLNKKTVKASIVESLRESLPPNFHILYGDSHWMKEATMCKILCLIKISLGSLFNRYHCVFLADCCKLHITAKLFRCASRIQFPYVPIPAKTTWFLQPLDTHVFGILKRIFGTKIQNLRANSANGEIGLLLFLQSFIDVAYDVLVLGSFRQAFLDNGISFKQVGVSNYIRRELEWEIIPPMALQPPSVDETAIIFPRYWRFDLNVVLNSSCPAQTCIHWPVAVPVSMRPALADVVEDEPITHILRSHTRRLSSQALLDSLAAPAPDVVEPGTHLAPERVHAEPSWPQVSFMRMPPVIPIP
jgi:hypothetical protein